MKVSVLGSGSGGNALLLVADDTRLLIDAGFSARDLARRLRAVGTDPDAIDAIVITHDHGDHTRGMGVYARRHGTPLYLTPATRHACQALLRGEERVEDYRAGHPFRIGPFRIEPFVTVHDAADPVGVAVVDVTTGCRVGVATDLGRPTAGIRHALSGSHLLVLEANHDEALLHAAPYPWSVKARIASSHGHLSNEGAARFAVDLLHDDLVAVFLAHLSREANDARLAADVVGRALRRAGYRGHLDVAAQDDPSPLVDLVRLRREHGPRQLTLL